MSLAARLRVYAPDGASTGFLPAPAKWSASLPHNDVSALTVDYPVAAPGAGLLDGPCEVAVEVSASDAVGRWVEPPNGRYRLVETSRDAARGGADVRSFSLQGYAGLMEGVTVVPPTKATASRYDSDGKRKFLSASVGQILLTVLGEARALVPGLVPGLDPVFSPTADSLGRPWGRRVTIYYEPGLSLLTVLDNLAQQGQCDWWAEGRTLRVVGPDAASRRTGVRLEGAATQAPARSSLAGLVHTALLVGEEQTWRVDNPAAPRPWGASMKVLSQGGVKDEGTARALIASTLQSGSAPRTEYTLTLPALTASPTPLVDYRVGDYVRSRTVSGAWEDMRVHQVTLSQEGKGLVVAMTLNDRFTDAEVRNAKRTKGIVNGASGDAGTGTVPTSPSRAVPAAPEGLVASTTGYWSSSVARSSVRASWAPVTQDVHGNAVTVDHYLLRVDGRTTTVKEPTGGVDNLDPGTTVTVAAAAVSGTAMTSAWATTTITTALPLTPLDPPTAPAVTCDSGMVSVTWDGLVRGAGDPYTPPDHLDHVTVHEATAPTGPWTLVGTLLAGTLVLDRQDALGQDRYYRTRAVDTLGRASDPSPTTRVTVTSQVAEQVAAAHADAARAAEAAVAARTQALAAVDALAQKIRRSPRAPTTSPDDRGHTLGDVWWQYQDPSLTGPIIGQWTWDGTAWKPATIASQVIASLTADKLVAGTGHLDTAFVRSLVTDQAFVGGLLAGRVVVATDSHNLIVNGDLAVADPAVGWDGFVIGDVDGRRVASWDIGRVTQTTIPPADPRWDQPLPPGTYTLTWTCRLTATAPANMYTTVDLALETTSPVHVTTPPGEADNPLGDLGTTRGQWRTFTRRIINTNPGNTVRRGTMTVRSRDTGGTLGAIGLLFSGITLTRRVSSILLEDGAVTADKLRSSSVTADKIAAGAVTAGAIAAKAVTTTALAAGSVTAGILTADAIDGKTITGATLQTTRAAAQGIKINDQGWTTYQRGKVAYHQDTNGNTSWTAWDSGTQIRVEPLGGFRDRPTIVLDPPTGVNQGWSLRGGNIFVSKSAAVGDFGAGAMVLTGAELRLNQSGRADLIIGPGPKWGLAAAGSSLPAASKSWVEADHGTVKISASTIELGTTQQGSGKANLRLLNLPATSGGLRLTVPPNSTSWRVGYEGSARRLKMDIRDVTQDVDPTRLLDVPVRSWADRWAWEQYTNYLEDHAEGGRNTGEWDDFSSPPPRVAGLVAEEVRDAGLDLYVYYRDGQIAALAYDRLWTLLIPLVRDLRGRVAALESREEVEPDDSNGNGG